MGSPRKCSAVLLIGLSRNQDVRSTSSNCCRTVPDPTMRAAFTDIGCKMFWRSECLPNTTMQCYGCNHRVPTRRSRDPVIPSAIPAISRRSAIPAGALAISVGFGPVSDPDPTAIGDEHDLGRIWPARSGLRCRAPTFGYERRRHRRVGEDTPRVDHEGGLRTQRFRVETGHPVRPVARRPSRGRPTSGHGRHTRTTDRRRRAGGVPSGHRVTSIGDVPVGNPSSCHRSRRCHRPTTAGAPSSEHRPVPSADRPSAPDPAATGRHRLHQHPAHDVRPRCGRPTRRVGRRRPRADTRTGEPTGARGHPDRPFEAGTIRRHRTAGGDRRLVHRQSPRRFRTRAGDAAAGQPVPTSARGIPPDHRGERGRFPLRGHAGDRRMRRLGLPRAASRPVRT